MKKTYKLKSEVWLYSGMAGWRFITIDKKTSIEINKNFGQNKRGFGSIPVEVSINKTIWETSIFPDKKSGTYLMPLKAQVRKKENIIDGQEISFSIKIR